MTEILCSPSSQTSYPGTAGSLLMSSLAPAAAAEHHYGHDASQTAMRQTTVCADLRSVVQNGRLCMLTSSADDIRGAVLGATPTGVFVEPQVRAMMCVQTAAISRIKSVYDLTSETWPGSLVLRASSSGSLFGPAPNQSTGDL